MKNKTILIKAAVYCRVSTSRQEQSIPNQKALAQRYAHEHGMEIIKYFIDDAISGKDTKARKAFLDMISEGTSKDCPFSVLLVQDVSRFSRGDSEESTHFEFILRQNNVKVIYVAEGFANDNSIGDKLMKSIKRNLAETFSKDQAQKTIRGSITYTRLGFSVGGRPPYGYDRLLVDKNGKPIKILKHGQRKSEKTEHVRYVLGDLAKVKVVKKIFDLVINKKKGLRKIAKILNLKKIPSPSGGLWTASTLKSILKNPVYTGCKIWNRSNRCNSSFDWTHDNIDVRIGDKKIGVTRWKKREEWIIAENAHSAIIDRKNFYAAQQVLEARRKYFSGSKMLKKNKKKRKNRKILIRKNLILTKIKSQESFTLGALAENFKVNRRTIERDIGDLKSEGKIIFVGSNRSGHYEVSKRL